MTGAAAFVAQLESEGVRHVFGNPGTTEQAFVREVARTPHMDYVLALQEAVAVGIADGAARASGQPTFVQLHAAAGLGNGLGMIYSAQVGRAPMVVYTGEPPTDQSALEPILYGQPASLAQPFVKWAARVDDVRQLVDVTRRAFKVAAEPPTGVVLLSVPSDVLDDEVDVAGFHSARVRWDARPPTDAVARIVESLLTAEHPALLCGDGVARGNAGLQAVALAERVGAAIVDVATSELTVPTTTPLFQGAVNMLSDRSIARDLAGFDTLVALGASLFPFINVSGAQVFQPHQKLIQIDPDGWELGKNEPADLLLRADIAQTLEEVSAEIENRAGGPFREAVAVRVEKLRETKQDRHERFVDALRSKDSTGSGMLPLELAEVLADTLPEDVIVVDESVTATGAVQQLVPRTRPGTVFRARGGGLGQGMATTVGVALSRPDQRVVGVVGDGAAMYTIQALWTAAHHGTPTVFLLCNNGSYHILKKNMQYYQSGGAPDPHLPYDLQGPALDLLALGQGFGVEGQVAETAEELAKALAVGLEHPGPYLIDARVRAVL